MGPGRENRIPGRWRELRRHPPSRFSYLPPTCDAWRAGGEDGRGRRSGRGHDSGRFHRDGPYFRICTRSSIGTIRTPGSSRSAIETWSSPQARARAWGLGDRGDHRGLPRASGRSIRSNLVEVLLPHHLHLEAALAALAAGKAVSVQKPMCTTLADADRLIDAAGQAGRPLRVFENFVFYPPVAKAKSLVDEGRDRGAVDDPRQEQPGAQRDRVGGPRVRPGVAPGHRQERRRPPGVRRRPPQVRARPALHGAGPRKCTPGSATPPPQAASCSTPRP